MICTRVWSQVRQSGTHSGAAIDISQRAIRFRHLKSLALVLLSPVRELETRFAAFPVLHALSDLMIQQTIAKVGTLFAEAQIA
jgi:hypothetical protein